MLTRVPKEVTNLAGGINTGIHCTNLQDNQFAEALNFFVLGDSEYARLMHGLIETITDFSYIIGAYKNSGGINKLISIGNTVEVIIPETSAIATLALRFGATPLTANNWQFIYQGKNHLYYIIDPVTGIMYRGTDLFYEKAGIAAPTTVPTVALNAAGVMAAGNYKVAITGYNEITGDESDYIESAVVALGANDSIDVSTIHVFAEPQAHYVRIYVTPVDQTNRYLYAGTVLNGVTTFNINLTSIQLGEILSDTNGVPPTGLKAGCVFDNSNFVTDGKLLYKSKYFQYETFDVDNDVQPIASEDGSECTVLHKWENKLVAGKENCLVYFVPTGSGDYIPTVFSEKTGVRSPHALKSKDNFLFWYDGEKFLKSTSGGSPEDISDEKIKVYLDDIPVHRKDHLSAAIIPRYDSYFVNVPQSIGYVQLMYNYRKNSWSTLNTAFDPRYVANGLDENNIIQVYGISEINNDIIEFLSIEFTFGGSLEDGDPVVYTLLTKGFKTGEISNLQTFLRSFALLCSEAGVTAKISVYENGKLAAPIIDEEDMYLSNNFNDWKFTALSTLGKSSGASYIQIRITLESPLPQNFNISRMNVELVSGNHITRQNV